MTPHENYRDISSISFFYFLRGVHGYSRRPLGGILSVCKTPGRLRGIENVTGAYINIVVSSKWVKYTFWVNYPFNNFFFLQFLDVANYLPFLVSNTRKKAFTMCTNITYTVHVVRQTLNKASFHI